MQLGERNWTEVSGLTHKVAVVPLGSLEQHGHHLPLLTDAMIGAEIARRAEAELGDEAVFLPMLWIGSSDHHLAFPGTVSLNAQTYTKVLIDLVESLLGAGFRRIFLLNAHAGNTVPAQSALLDVQMRRRREYPDLWLSFASWFEIAAAQVAAIDGLTQDRISHACEWETSAIERIRPELVRKEAAHGANYPFDSAFYVPDYSAASRVSVARTMDQNSSTGAYGHPERATPEKGEAIFAAATKEVVAFVREFARWPDVLEPS